MNFDLVIHASGSEGCQAPQSDKYVDCGDPACPYCFANEVGKLISARTIQVYIASLTVPPAAPVVPDTVPLKVVRTAEG